MDCNQALAIMYSYLDGELEESVYLEVQTHVHHCTNCLEGYEFEYELKLVIAKHCHEDLPEAIQRKILDKLAEEQAANKPAVGEAEGVGEETLET